MSKPPYEEKELTEEEARKRLKKLFRGEILDGFIEAAKSEALDKWIPILIIAFIPATLITAYLIQTVTMGR